MKVRTGFVSNSSSSSFVIMKRDLNYGQIEMINDHMNIVNRLIEQGSNVIGWCDYSDEWHISDTDMTVEGYTDLDNFDMHDFLIKIVGVNKDKIDWFHS